MRLASRTIEGRVTGPYVYKGRRWVTIEGPAGKRSMAYARFVLQEHLGRVLEPSEHVDHVDEDRLNDAVGNLQILTNSENAKKSNGPPELVAFDCPVCGAATVKLARFVRNNRRQGKAGPFCGRPCARRWQLGRVGK